MIAALLDLDEGARPSVEAVDQMRRRLPHRHNVGDYDRLAVAREAGCVELLGVAQHPVHLRHVGERLRRKLRRAAGDDDAPVRVLAAQLADCLPRLADRLAGHGAGVDDYCVEPGGARFAADHLGLEGVEAAAEGDDGSVRHGAAVIRPARDRARR